MLAILFYHASLSFLIFDLFFLIPAAIAQIFHPIEKLVIYIVIPSQEAKAEIEINPVIEEAKKSVQCNLELSKPYCAFYSSIEFALFLEGSHFQLNQ